MKSVVCMAIVAGLTAACTSVLPADQFRVLSDAHHYSLMEGENATIGDYLNRKDFNSGLKWECREQDKAPYPELFGMMDTLTALNNAILGNRGAYYAKREALLEAYPSQVQKRRKHAVASEADDYASALDSLAGLKANYAHWQSRYDSICSVHGIRRVTHAQYADSLLRRMERWQDSLVVQGRIIGKGRMRMRAADAEVSDPSYQRVYKPLSQMEKLHKQFQSQLLLVENQHGRFDRSRPDEYYYMGPYLVRRHDIEKTEEEIVEMGEMMERFNALKALFDNAYSEAGW